MNSGTRSLLFALACLCAQFTLAQSEDFAYVPKEAPERTADDVAIGFKDTEEPGVVAIALPAGTYGVDLLNASGNVERELTSDEFSRLDLRALRAGTWTLRAHSPNGLHVRRFVVLGRGGTVWVNPRKPKGR